MLQRLLCLGVVLSAFCLCMPCVLAQEQRTPPAKEQPAPPKDWMAPLTEEQFAALHELRKGGAPKLHGKDIEVGGAKAYLSLPPGRKPTGAVLVIHEWWGLNDHIRHWSDRLAADGVAALAIDLYGGVVATKPADALAAMRAVDPKKALKTLRAGHAFLAADPRVAAKKRACIGWCFGGEWSLQLAMAEPDLSAAVVYYGHLESDPAKLAGIRAPILGVFGNLDRGIPPAAVDAFAAAMKKSKKRLELHRYEANHAFANPSSGRYDQKHASRAWAKVRAFLRKSLAPEGLLWKGTRKLRFSAPEGWRRGPARAMRLLTFEVRDAECYVSAFSGPAGGVAANIRRWHAQMGKEPPSADDLKKLPRMLVLEGDAVMCQVEGAYRGFSGARIDDAMMLGAVCSLAKEVVFVKMIGSKATVRKELENFRAFCTSLR